MPFPMKIQPLDSQAYGESDSAKPVLKSRLKRLFDRQFRTSPAPAPAPEFEPSSLCLAKMVQNFIEENNEKNPPAKCGRSRCNCFNGNVSESSDEEYDVVFGFSDSTPTGSFGDSLDVLKGLVPCATVCERNLLADTWKIVEKNKSVKMKEDLRKIVAGELLVLGYDASVCRSRWEKSSSYPAGDYEYMDAIIDGERVLIDIDFRSEFEIARSTSAYKSILQSLPVIFVGRADRLYQIVSIVSEAARLSLKKKGMHVPPWRKAEYMKAKWLSPHRRTAAAIAAVETVRTAEKTDSECGELELIFGEDFSPSPETESAPSPVGNSGEVEILTEWQPPAVKPKTGQRGGKVVTGLASLLREKP